MKEYGIRFEDWTASEPTAAFEASSDRVHIRSTATQYEYLGQSPVVKLAGGAYEIAYEVDLVAGGVTVGLQNADDGAWLVTNNHDASAAGVLRCPVPWRGRRVRLTLASCNAAKTDTDVRISSVRVERTAGPAAMYADRVRGLGPRWIRWWRTRGRPALYLARLRLQIAAGRTAVALKRGRGGRLRFHVVDSAEVGYAVRSIVLARSGGATRLLTADIGHDTMSSVAVESGRLGSRATIHFPAKSTPMYLVTLAVADDADDVAACFFNFDTTGTEHTHSYLSLIDDIPALERKGRIDDIGAELPVLLERKGHWGFRGACVVQDKNRRYALAAIDRDESAFHLLRGAVVDGRLEHEVRTLRLEDAAEPIGVSAACVGPDPLRPTFYMSARKTAEIIVVGVGDDGTPELRQRFEVPGRSRSSVAVGRFRSADSCDVAVALWGGDPGDLDSIVKGQFVVARVADDGTLSDAATQEAGVHPTDAAAADFDGDGIDELVVLNYGAGLGPADRVHPGGVEIYKYAGERFECVARIALPNPRIAAIADIDGDGVPELIVSLFFEDRVVVIKPCGGG